MLLYCRLSFIRISSIRVSYFVIKLTAISLHTRATTQHTASDAIKIVCVRYGERNHHSVELLVGEHTVYDTAYAVV